MNVNEDWSGAKVRSTHDGVFDVPIAKKDAEVALRITGSRLSVGDTENDHWGANVPVNHEPRLLPIQHSVGAEAELLHKEEEIIEVYIDSIEDLDSLRVTLADRFQATNDVRQEFGPENQSRVAEDLYQVLQSHYSDLNEAIRHQKDFIEAEDEESISSHGAKIGTNVSLFVALQAEFIDELESEASVVKQEYAMEDEAVREEAVSQTKSKTGWWDNDFRQEQGAVDESRAVPAPKWGDEELSVENKNETEPINLTYEQARQEWLEAKAVHETAHQAYNEAVSEYYDSLNHNSYGSKLLTRAKASLGFKPELPADITAMQNEMFTATEAYNRSGRVMLENRAFAGKASGGEKANEIAQRYQRLLARSLVLNTFNEQRKLQTEAVENLNFKPGRYSEFFKQNKKGIRLVGAGAVGLMTGGLGGVVAGGVWWARSTAGSVASVVATNFVGEKMNSVVSQVETDVQKEYEGKINLLAERLDQGTVSASELQDIYNDLSSLYYRVDVVTQKRIMALLATAIGTGLLAGVTAGAVTELVGIDVAPNTPVETSAVRLDTATEDVLRAVEQPDAKDAVLQSAVVAPEADAPAVVSAETVPTTAIEDAPAATYLAEKGNNLWDIMEGQTDAEGLSVMKHISEGDKQSLIAKVAERINGDETLRAEIGLGDSADTLREGGEVNLVKLNEIAEAVAKENNFDVPASDTELATAGTAIQADSLTMGDAELLSAINETPASQSGPETIIVTKVSPEQINDFARNYPKGLYSNGFQNFNHDFQTQWIDKIQGPPAVSGGFLEVFFNSPPNSDSAYNEFDAWKVGDFKKLATIDESILARTLADKNIDMADYTAWKDVLAKWEDEGLVIDSQDRFSDVAEVAFIKSLAQSPKP